MEQEGEVRNPAATVLEAAGRVAPTQREDRLTEVLACISEAVPEVRDALLRILGCSEVSSIRGNLDIRTQFRVMPLDGKSKPCIPDLCIGRFDERRSSRNQLVEGVAIEVKIDADLTEAEKQGWPALKDAENVLRRALVPRAYSRQHDLEEEGFEVSHWEEFYVELRALESSIRKEKSKHLIAELIGYLERERGIEVSGKMGLEAKDMDGELKEAQEAIARFSSLVNEVQRNLENAGLRKSGQLRGGSAAKKGELGRWMHLESSGAPEGGWFEAFIFGEGSALNLGDDFEKSAIVALTLSFGRKDWPLGDEEWQGIDPGKTKGSEWQRSAFDSWERIIKAIRLSALIGETEGVESQAKEICKWIEDTKKTEMALVTDQLSAIVEKS